MVHDTVNKRQFAESVDILDIPTFKWEQKCIPDPPAGVRNYACATRGNSIFYYGGINDCFHDYLFELNTLTHNCKEIISRSDDSRPMKKIAFGMMSFKSNGQDNLLLLGGLGITPSTAYTQMGSKYIPSPRLHGHTYTNETHVMSVSSSPGIT